MEDLGECRRYYRVMDSDRLGPPRRAGGLRGVGMPDVPDDPARGEDHRKAEDLGHESLRRATEDQDADPHPADRGDSHGRGKPHRGPPGMAQARVLEVPGELARNRGEGAQGSREYGGNAEEED